MDETRVREIAELECRKYFDMYLQQVFPMQVKAMKEHTANAVKTHDLSPEAHGGVERRVNKFFWLLLGGASAGGAGLGAFASKLITILS